MKNLFKIFVPMAVAAIALASCQKEADKIGTPSGKTYSLTIIAQPDELRGEDVTKSYIDGYTIKWGTGEYMKACVTKGETSNFDNSSDGSADSYNGQSQASFNFTLSEISGSGNYLLQGIYPASAAVASNNTTPANYKVNLPATQNATASSYDPAAYIMVANPQEFSEIPSIWSASFRRATALNKLTLKGIPSDVSIKRVKITAPSGMYLAGGRHINLSTGASGDIYSGGGRTESLEVKFETPAAGGSDIDVWFTSWGVELEAGATLTIVAYTTNKKSYTKTINLTGEQKISFKEGYLNTLGATGFGSITPEDVTELEEGNYVVLAKDGTNYYALKAEKEDNKQRLLSVAYEGSIDSYLGDADIIWSLTKSGDSFIFENDSKYLGYKGSDNESYWLAADENWTTDNYLLDITAQETVGLYHVTLHSNASRYLSKNSSGAFFAFYGNTSQKADIVFVPATVDTRSDVVLSFDESTISLTTTDYDQFLGQDVVASPNVAAITGNLVWSYEDTDGIIDEFDEGAIILTGNPGTATVTVSFAGDENYKAATASYTITVSSASGPQYNLVSAVADVVEGDYIITWNNTYYLPSGSTSGTNPAVGTGITVSGDKITNTVSSDMVWHFSGNNSDGFTISDGTNILNSTNAAQGISITTNSTRKWTVSVDNTYGMLLHGDDGGTRYLAVYNSATWRYYSTGNSYTGTLRLYKLATAPDTRQEAGMSWSSASASASIDDGDVITFTAPTLSNPNSVSPLTYASTNTDVAEINVSGAVTVKAEGTTTIQAIFAGNDSYKPQTVEYELTVTDNRTPVVNYDFQTVAELNDLVTSESAEYSGYLTGAVVSFVPAGNTAIVKDATGSIMFYKTSVGLQQGQTYTGAINVTAVKYNSLYSEITAWDASFTGSQASVAPESVALADLIGNYDDYQNAYVSVAGLTVQSISSKNINVTDGNNTYVVYYNPNGDIPCAAGDVITAVGTITKYQSTEEIKVWKAADITVTGSAPKAVTFEQPDSGGSFTVSVGGSPISSGTTVASGTTVTLAATVASGFYFDGWTVTGATVADATASTTSFTMGTSAVTVSANFREEGSTTPDPETIDFSTLGLENGEQYLDPFNGGNFTVTFAGGSNDGKYYNTGAAMRVYVNGYFTVASSSYTIAKIELTFGSGDSSNEITTNVGSFSTNTWTGSASSVKFTVGGSSGHRRIQKIKVTYAGGGSTPAPTTYSVNIDNSISNGTVTASKTTGIAENEQITLTIAPNNNYTLGTLTVDNVNVTSQVSNGTYSFSMPAHDVSVSATFTSSGDTPTITTYTFTTKSWGDSTNSWTSGKDGNQFTSGRGVQVTTGASGANATTKSSLSGVSQVVVTYSTNASNGAGSIAVQIGSNTAHSQDVTKTGGTTDRTLTYTINPAESGNVKLTVTCTTNSIYVKSVAITHN